MATELEQGFAKMLQDEELCKLFRHFVKSTHSGENFTFWLEVQKFRKIPDAASKDICTEALRLFNVYFSEDAEHELNITAPERSAIENSLLSPSPTIYDAVQKSIFKLMATDSYPKFMRSEMYKQHMEQQHTEEFPASPRSNYPMTVRERSKQIQHSTSDRKMLHTLTWRKKGIASSTSTGSLPNVSGFPDSAPTNGSDFLRGRELQRQGSQILFDDYITALKKVNQPNPKELLPEDRKLVCHVNVITDKNIWKIVDLDISDTLEDAIKKILKKAHIAEDSWREYVLLMNATEDEKQPQHGQTTRNKILRDDETLVSQGVKSQDSLVLKPKQEKTDEDNGGQLLRDIKIINIKGDEELCNVSFKSPVFKLVSWICYKYDYPSENGISLYYAAPSSSSKSTIKELDMWLSLADQGVPVMGTLQVKKKSKKMLARADTAFPSQLKFNEQDDITTRQRTPQGVGAGPKYFGLPLASVCTRHEDTRKIKLPYVFRICTEYLQKEIALRKENIFYKRVSPGNSELLRAYEVVINNGGEIDLVNSCKDPHLASSLLLLFFDELPEALFPVDQSELLLNGDDEREDDGLKKLIQNLPEENKELLNSLTSLLSLVLARSTENMMTPERLTEVFCPIFFRHGSNIHHKRKAQRLTTRFISTPTRFFSTLSRSQDNLRSSAGRLRSKSMAPNSFSQIKSKMQSGVVSRPQEGSDVASELKTVTASDLPQLLEWFKNMKLEEGSKEEDHLKKIIETISIKVDAASIRLHQLERDNQSLNLQLNQTHVTSNQDVSAPL